MLSDVVRLEARDGVLGPGCYMFVDRLLDSVMIIPDKTGSAGKTEDAESNNNESDDEARVFIRRWLNI